MKERDWAAYYNRWVDWFNCLDNKEKLIDRIVRKYGNKHHITDIMWFDIIYEYGVKYGTYIEQPIDAEVLEECYEIDGYRITLVFVEHAFITIVKTK